MDATNTIWMTRLGTPYEAAKAGIDRPSEILDANLTKGTARFEYLAKCGRCGGLGGSDAWAHTGWTCFECGGSKYAGMRDIHLYTAERLDKLNVTQAKRDATKAAKAAKKAEAQREAAKLARVEFYAANGPVIDAISAYAEQDSFIADLVAKLEEYGTLSEKQLAAALTAVARCKARAGSQFVGTEGTRVELTLTVERCIVLESFGRFAAPTIHLCRDENGNRVVYKGTGSSFPVTGETAKVKATIDRHDNYRGENQTHIARPKTLELVRSLDMIRDEAFQNEEAVAA